jgi:hypothetical protein
MNKEDNFILYIVHHLLILHNDDVNRYFYYYFHWFICYIQLIDLDIEHLVVHVLFHIKKANVVLFAEVLDNSITKNNKSFNN